MLPAEDIGEAKSDDIQKAVYLATKGAGDLVDFAGAKEWLPTYEGEVARAASFGTSNKSLTRSEHQVPPHMGFTVGIEILPLLRRETFARHAYWFLQIRNMKYQTQHSQDDHADTTHWIDSALKFVRRDGAYIFVDMGLMFEPLDTRFCVRPKRERLAGFSEMLFGVTQAEFDAAGPHYDAIYHCAHTAGVRVTFASPVTHHGLSYLQHYVTDKITIYNAGARGLHRAMHLFGLCTMRCHSPNDQIKPIIRVYDALWDCRNAESPPQPAYRVEVRVPLEFASTVLPVDIARARLPEFMDLMRVKDVWYVYRWLACLCPQLTCASRSLPMHQVTACNLFFRLLSATPSNCRIQLEQLSLNATVQWWFNATLARPSQRFFDVQLLGDTIPHDTRRSLHWRHLLWFTLDLDERIPTVSHGMHSLPMISFAPDDSNNTLIAFETSVDGMGCTSAENICRWFGCDNLDDIRAVLRLARLDRADNDGTTVARRVAPTKLPRAREIAVPAGVDNLRLPARPVAMYATGEPVDPAQRGPSSGGEMLDVANTFLRIAIAVMQLIPTTQITRLSRLTIKYDQCDRLGLQSFRDMNLQAYFPVYNAFRRADTWDRIAVCLYPYPTDIRAKNKNRHSYSRMTAWAEVVRYTEDLYEGPPESKALSLRIIRYVAARYYSENF